MRRRRTRRRRGGRRWRAFATVVLAAVVVTAWVGFPSGSYVTAHLDRGSAADVVTDADGALGLDRAASVELGTTDTMFTLRNQLGSSASVTVTLASGSTDAGDLVVDGTDEGDTATFTLAEGNSQVVELDTPCDDSLVGRTVTYTVNASTAAVEGTLTRATDITDGACSGGYRAVFVNKNDQTLSTIDVDGGTEKVHLSHKVSEIGPARTSLDDDGAREIPYVYNNKIKIIGIGETTPVTLDGSQSVNQEPVGIGDFDGDGEDEVYYNREKNLYAVRDGESPTEVVSSSAFTSELTAIAGVVDFDGDGALEIVFANNNNGVGYVDENGTPTTTGYQNLGDVHSVGRPADFDGDGEVRVPVVTSSSHVALVDYRGNATVLDSSYGQAALDSVAAHDIDGDGTLEVVFADTNADLRYMELDGSHANVRNTNGTVLSANKNKGAA